MWFVTFVFVSSDAFPGDPLPCGHQLLLSARHEQEPDHWCVPRGLRSQGKRFPWQHLVRGQNYCLFLFGNGQEQTSGMALEQWEQWEPLPCIQHSIPSHLVGGWVFTGNCVNVCCRSCMGEGKNKTPARLTDSGMIVWVIRPLGDLSKKIQMADNWFRSITMPEKIRRSPVPRLLGRLLALCVCGDSREEPLLKDRQIE